MDKFIKSLFKTTAQNLVWFFYLITIIWDWDGLAECQREYAHGYNLAQLSTTPRSVANPCRSLIIDIFVFTLVALVLTAGMAAKSRKEPEDEQENKQKDK